MTPPPLPLLTTLVDCLGGTGGATEDVATTGGPSTGFPFKSHRTRVRPVVNTGDLSRVALPSHTQSLDADGDGPVFDRKNRQMSKRCHLASNYSHFHVILTDFRLDFDVCLIAMAI